MKQLIIDIKRIVPRKPRRLVNIDLPLQSKDPILVKKDGKKFIIINGHHRFFKNLEMGNKQIEVIVKNG